MHIDQIYGLEESELDELIGIGHAIELDDYHAQNELGIGRRRRKRSARAKAIRKKFRKKFQKSYKTSCAIF